MKRSMAWIALAACFLLVAGSALSQQLGSKDAEFVKEAAQGGMLEVKLGELALEHAKSPDVKNFAKRMVDDHSKANKELMSLASAKTVKLSKDFDKEFKEVSDKLIKLKGADFDREYMKHMVEDHEKDVAKFETASQSLTDPDLKAWAKNTLPTLREHLKMAKEVYAKVSQNK